MAAAESWQCSTQLRPLPRPLAAAAARSRFSGRLARSCCRSRCLWLPAWPRSAAAGWCGRRYGCTRGGTWPSPAPQCSSSTGSSLALSLWTTSGGCTPPTAASSSYSRTCGAGRWTACDPTPGTGWGRASPWPAASPPSSGRADLAAARPRTAPAGRPS